MQTDPSSKHDKRKTRSDKIINLPLDSCDYGTCIKDLNGKVISQNEACKVICGEQSQAECTQCALEESIHAPFVIQKKAKISGTLCQAVILKNDTQITTLFMPIKTTQDALKEQLKACQLTPTESIISRLLVDKKTNQEIITLLQIQKSTLRTHINHLYQKAPFLKGVREEF